MSPIIGNDQFVGCFGIVPAADDEALPALVRNAVRQGFAIVPVIPGGKKPICTLTARQAKAADLEAQAAGKVRHACGIEHALTDPDKAATIVRRLMKDRGGINIGVEVGLSRMVHIDADTATELAGFLTDWSTESGIDRTGRRPTVTSPGKIKVTADGTEKWVHKDGGHFWFTVPPEIDLASLPGSGTLAAESGWVASWKEHQALVPPSNRPEGPYVLTGQVEPAPEWLLDRIQMHAHSFAERQARQRDRIRHNGDPIDVWSAGVPWADLLGPDGWTNTGLPDNCGCPIWTRPGDPGSPKSATAHDLGCTRFDADTGHGPLHIWTDNPPEHLADAMRATGKRTFTKLEYIAWRDHGGRNYEAMRELDLEFLGGEDEQAEVDALLDGLDFLAPPTAPPAAGPVVDDEDEGGDLLDEIEPEPVAANVPPEVTALVDLTAQVDQAEIHNKLKREVVQLALRDQAKTFYDRLRNRAGRQDLKARVKAATDRLDQVPDDEEEVPWRIADLWQQGQTVLLSAQYKAGKAVDIAEPILTDRGWATMGDLHVGDRVHAPDGSLTRIEYTSPIMFGRQCYQVTFADGRHVVVDAEHLWTVQDSALHRELTLTTEEMAGRVVRWSNATNQHYRYGVSTTAGLERPDRSLLIDPYVLGAWLGDGATDQARITTADPEITAEFEAAGYPVTKRYTGNSGQAETVAFKGLYVELREIGVLGDKHVPEDYLTASRSQRLALLQGLLDTDGCVCPNSRSNSTRIEFTSTREVLAEAVLFLARSLGWRATMGTGRATLNGRDCGPKYRVAWTAYVDQEPFRLPRKQAVLRPCPDRAPRSSTVKIVAIEPVTSRPVRCIQVAHPTKLYLVGRGLIPTHNTTMVLNVIRSLVDGKPFLGQFETTAVERNVYVVNAEMTGRQFRRWLREAGIGNRDKVYAMHVREAGTAAGDILDPGSREILIEALVEADAQVLILDPLNPLLSAAGVDENASTEVAKWFNALTDLVERSPVEDVFLVHHFGHAGERGRGSSKFMDAPDALWTYTKGELAKGKRDDEDDDLLGEIDAAAEPRFLAAIGRDVDLAKSRVDFDAATRTLVMPVVGAGPNRSAEKAARTEMQHEQLIGHLVSFVVANPGISSGALFAKVGGKKDRYGKALQEAEDRGLITNEGTSRSKKFVVSSASDPSDPIGPTHRVRTSDPTRPPTGTGPTDRSNGLTYQTQDQGPTEDENLTSRGDAE